MLGNYLRSKIAIVLAVLGLVILGLGIGQRTIWLPPATVTAAVQGTITPAPLTVIDPAVLQANGGDYTMTIKAKGPIQLAVGQQRDVMAWVGDAAYTSVSGISSDFKQVTASSKTGAAEVPNPTGSDLWISEQDADGSMSYTWKSPGPGTWAVLLSSDGKAAAPTDISLTSPNDQSTPWAIPLMVLGSALLAIAALFFWISPRKKQPAVAVAAGGRRAAGRAPSDPATGALEVARILAAKEAAQAGTPAAEEPAATHATIAEMNLAQRQAKEAAEPDAETTAQEAALPSTDATSAIPVIDVPEPSDASDAASTADVEHPSADSEDGKKVHDSAPATEAEGAKEAEDATKSAEDDESDHGDDSHDKNDGGTSASAETDSSAADESEKEDSVPEKKNKGSQKSERRSFGTSLKVKLGAIAAATLLVGGVSPAVAEESATPSPSSSEVSSSTATPSTAASSTPTPSAAASGTASASATAAASTPAATGSPELVLTQVERIAADLATVVSSGDSAKNAKELSSRVAGLALQSRTANYKIRAKDSSYAAPEPVAASKLLTYVSPNAGTFPRTAIVVTQGTDNKLPQVLVMVQESARENYKLTQQSPLLPGQTFPEINVGNVASLATDSKDGLAMSPKDAVAALADVLGNSNSKFASTFATSLLITDTKAYREKVAKASESTTVKFTATAADGSVTAMQTKDGGALVVAGYTLVIDSTPKDGAKANLEDKSLIALAGGSSSEKGTVVDYSQPVILYIPPASASDAKITVTSGIRDLIGAKIK